MNIARINTKYGNVKSFQEKSDKIRRACKNCEIMIDINSLKYLKWLKRADFDYLAVAFTESAEQLKKIRKLICKKTKLIAKIENKKGLRNIDSIIDEADGVMVARGDLAKNTPFEKVTLVQKMIMRKCKVKRKMDIAATEMLFSMTNSKTPTRAEVSDVTNAVLDSANAVMLSEETAIGKYPVLTIKTMKKIVGVTEKYLFEEDRYVFKP